MTAQSKISNILLAAAFLGAAPTGYAAEPAQSINISNKSPVPKVLDRSAPICEGTPLGAFKRCTQTTLLEVQDIKKAKDIYVQTTTCDVNIIKNEGACHTELTKFGEASFAVK